MNLRQPPVTEDLKELCSWLYELYQYLQFPAQHLTKFVPRAEPDGEEGIVYHNKTTHKLRHHNGTTYEDL